MIAEMGVKTPSASTFKKENPLNARCKLRSVAFMVLASVRMQKMSQNWSRARKIGEGLRRAKGEVLRRRESAMRKGLLQS
jgi:hypothetical protein